MFSCIYGTKLGPFILYVLISALYTDTRTHTRMLSHVCSWYKIDEGQATTGCAVIISIHKETKMNYSVGFLVYVEKLTSMIKVIT